MVVVAVVAAAVFALVAVVVAWVVVLADAVAEVKCVEGLGLGFECLSGHSAFLAALSF